MTDPEARPVCAQRIFIQAHLSSDGSNEVFRSLIFSMKQSAHRFIHVLSHLEYHLGHVIAVTDVEEAFLGSLPDDLRKERSVLFDYSSTHLLPNGWCFRP